MSLFACEECNVVENTALCGWVERPGGGRHMLCSQCNPDIGKWHGIFGREDAAEAGYELEGDGPYLSRPYRKGETE